MPVAGGSDVWDDEGPAPDEATPEPADAAAPPDAFPAPAPAFAGERGVFCNQCGWKNPPGARFCSQCGHPLQVEAAAGPVPVPVAAAAVHAGTREPRGARPAPAPVRETGAGDAGQSAGRQVAIVVGAGVLLVVALFLITLVSKERAAPAAGPAAAAAGTGAAPAAEATPLPPEVASQVRALETEISGLSGEARAARQAELVNLLLGAGQIAPAAAVQLEVAQALDTPEAWRRAGNLYYDLMMTLEGTDRVGAATQAVEAYQKVLASEPDNLDVRTDMATAYLSSNNPMEGVAQVKQVLESNPNHVQANFNYGIMLMQINRIDQARAQFEKVKEIVGPESPVYQAAEARLAALPSGS